MKNIFLGIMLITAVVCSGCSESENNKAASNHGLVKRYEAIKIKEAIKIDGVLNEKSWAKAKTPEFYIFKTLEKPVSITDARILWDDTYIYIGFKCYDKDIYGYFSERDNRTCLDDVAEFFFNTNPKEGTWYYNFEVNCLGTIYDAFSPKYNFAGNTFRWLKWNCDGLKVKTKIEGTLNDYRDKDNYWTLEMAIPFKSLPSLKGKGVSAGDVWKFNLARYDYSIYIDNEKGREIITCAPIIEKSFAIQDSWHELIFVK